MTRMMTTMGMAVLFFGCTVPDSKLLSELSSDEALGICQEFSQPADSVDCDGTVVEIPATDDANCAAGITDKPATCTATVGDYRDCADATSEVDVCDPPAEVLPACEPLFSGDCLPSVP